jgi:hypothetical protein
VVTSFSTPVPVFDSLGVSHQLTATYTKLERIHGITMCHYHWEMRQEQP